MKKSITLHIEDQAQVLGYFESKIMLRVKKVSDVVEDEQVFLLQIATPYSRS